MKMFEEKSLMMMMIIIFRLELKDGLRDFFPPHLGSEKDLSLRFSQGAARVLMNPAAFPTTLS
jgi:hypothetical protein